MYLCILLLAFGRYTLITAVDLYDYQAMRTPTTAIRVVTTAEFYGYHMMREICER